MESDFLTLSKYPVLDAASSKKGKEVPTPYSNKKIKKSLEEIVSAHNSKKGSGRNPLEDMISDKVETLKASVVALLEEIKLREDLNSNHFNKINCEICKLHTDLLNLDNVNISYPNDLLREINEARSRINDNVLELEREKRNEGLECWRDLMFLKKYLMGALKDYWELVRRRRVLEN